MKIHLFAIALTSTACVGDHNVGNTTHELAPPRWVISLDGTGGDRGIAVAIDSAGDVVAGGQFGGVPTMEGSPTILTKRAGVDGAELWSVTLEEDPIMYVELADLAVNDDREVIAVGRYLRGSDAFVAMYSANGNLAWKRRFTNESRAALRSVAVGADDRIYVSGTFAGVISAPNAVLGAPSEEGFIAAFDSDGTMRWAHAFPGTWGFRLAMGSDGALVATATISKPSPFGATTVTPLAVQTQVLARISPDGDVLSARALGEIGVATANGALALADDRMVFVSDTGVWDDTVTISMTDVDGTERWSHGNVRRAAVISDAVVLSDGTTVTVGTLPEPSDELGDAGVTASTYLRAYGPDGSITTARAYGDRYLQSDSTTTALSALGASVSGAVAFTGTLDQPVDFGTGTVLRSHGSTDIVIGLIDPND